MTKGQSERSFLIRSHGKVSNRALQDEWKFNKILDDHNECKFNKILDYHNSQKVQMKCSVLK